MKNLILILCCVFCCSSCWQYDLDSRKALMTDSLLVHFPEPSLIFVPVGVTWSEVMIDSIYYPNDVDPFITLYIYKCHNTEKLNQLIQQYKKKSVYTVMSEDTTYYLTLLDQEGNVRIGDKNNLTDRYDFDHKPKAPFFRNMATKIGSIVAGKGKPYDIRGYGLGKLTHRFY